MRHEPVAILVPVLQRPHRVAPLTDSIAAATTTPHRVLFIADPNDDLEHQAIRDTGGELLITGGSCPAKWNVGTDATDEPLIMYAADDLRFTPGWLDAAMLKMVNDIQVVGLNDLCSRRVREGRHATHFLVKREYAQTPCIDGRQGPFCDLYSHSFCDDEFVATARKRQVIAFATDSHVIHEHPDNGLAETDATYAKGRKYLNRDRRLFVQRERRWQL